MADDSLRRPESRYGRQKVPRRGVAIAVAVLVVAAGIVVALVGYQRLGGGGVDVDGKLGGYQLIDDQTVDVTMSVTRTDPARPAVCILRARSKDGSEIGRREVLVPPSDQATVQVTATVKTSRPPVIGDVYGCGTDVPAYLTEP